MTGPEHYREAERLVAEAGSGAFVGYGRDNHLAAAQVHATLALAAATAEPIALSLGSNGADIARAWSEAIS